MSCGKTCAIASALILVVCGIAIMILGMMHQNLMPDSLDKGCRNMAKSTECIVVSYGEDMAAYIGPIDKEKVYNDCMWKVKNETGDCKCPGTKDDMGDHKGCDCSGTSFGAALDVSKALFIGVSVWGLVMCLCVAGLAIMATRTPEGCFSVFFYSTCSGLLHVVFVPIGGLFIVLGMASSADSSPIIIFMDNCKANVLDMMEDDSKAAECVADAACFTFETILKSTTTLGYGVGIPYFVAGMCMFVACYACCCCKSQFTEEAPTGGIPSMLAAAQQELPMAHAADDDVPGAEFYPPVSRAAVNKNQTGASNLYPSAY